MCQYCKMTIVDKQHAAELVTLKGKVYKYDAIECLVPHLLKGAPENYSFILVNDYNNPGSLIDGPSSYFLISDAIPSPMGAFLSAFESKSAAEKIANSKGGEVYDWNELKMRFSSKLTNL